VATSVPEAEAAQVLSYDFPSQPHTGLEMDKQVTGRGLQVPATSPLRHAPKPPRSQYSVLEQGAAPHNIDMLLPPEPGLPPLPPLCVLPPVPTAPPVPGAPPTQALRVHSNWPSLQVQVLQLSEAEVVFP